MDWIGDNEVLFGSLVTLSIITFFGTLLAVPWVLVRLPPDYFQMSLDKRVPMRAMHPLLRALLLVGKNLLGALFVVMGIAMLLLPGQGLLTILIGLLLLDFPGKYKVERYVVSRRPVLRSINWLRERARREPLQLERPPSPDNAASPDNPRADSTRLQSARPSGPSRAGNR